jgi:hypothetical protein
MKGISIPALLVIDLLSVMLFSLLPGYVVSGYYNRPSVTEIISSQPSNANAAKHSLERIIHSEFTTLARSEAVRYTTG